MANGKGKTEMTPTENVTQTKPFALKVTELKPKQNVLDLETNEDAAIEVKSVRYEAPVFQTGKTPESTGWTCTIDGKPQFVPGTAEEFEQALYNAAEALIQPRSKQIEAFLYRATQESYQAGKAAALAAGNYLTQDLRKRIVSIMSMMNAYAEVSASDCYKRWLSGYKEGKPGALKLLKMAQDQTDEVDDL